MKYFLSVKRLEENKDYEAQLEEWKRYPHDFMRENVGFNGKPLPEIPINALDVIITEEEFIAIKKAVIEVIH